MVLLVSKDQHVAAMRPQGAMVMIVMILLWMAIFADGCRGNGLLLAADDKEQDQY